MAPLAAPRVTIYDVAAKAGVSQPTASLVLSNHPRARVAPATRQRVLDVAAAIGYRPNVVARSLSRRRSFALGLIVPDLGSPVVAEVVAGVERVAADAGYAVLLCDHSARPLAQHLELLRARQIDGVLLDAVGAAALPAEALAGLRVVLIDEPTQQWPGVASDALAAGRLAAEHLLALGHRELAFMGPAVDSHAFRMRERGFVAALRAAGVDIPSPRWLRVPAPSVSAGRDAMRRLLATPRRPTAVFCANDLLAIGALKQALNAGLAVPHDLSVVGCDDIELARYVTPELTTVRVPARELGARAARLLLRQVDARPPRREGATLLPVQLVPRASSGPVPPASPRAQVA
jgi:LacI family transcriptional regulator